MRKIKTILVPVCMTIFFIGCVQFFLLTRMSMFNFLSIGFFYGILSIVFCILIIAYQRKNKSFFLSAAIFIIAFMCVRIFQGQIEDYYFLRSASVADIIKADLKAYQKTHSEFPGSLEGLYIKSPAPRYNIGFIRYDFGYTKTDTTYWLTFNHFECRTFISKGESHTWNVYD